MSIFPQCVFDVSVPGAKLTSGVPVEGTCELVLTESIPRARAVIIAMRSVCQAVYGSGNSRSAHTATMFEAECSIRIPGRELAAGIHRFPFKIELPAWLPPAFEGPDCSIEHEIKAKLDVEWAWDPSQKIAPRVVMGPSEGMCEPVTVRSPPGLHSSIVLEAMFESTTVAQNQLVRGELALRSGHDARFDAVEIHLVNVFGVVFGRGEQRRQVAHGLKIAASALRGGDPVKFTLPVGALPSFKNPYFSHYVAVQVKVVIPFARDPGFAVDLIVLPAGSRLVQSNVQALPVGSEWLNRLAEGMAARTGLARGRLPTLVQGAVGPVELEVRDAPGAGTLGMDVELTYPDLQLGIRFRERGLLTALTRTLPLPEALADRYSLDAAPFAPDVEASVVGDFAAQMLDGLPKDVTVRFDDHRLAFHFPITGEDARVSVGRAELGIAKAKRLARLMAALPFPPGLAEHRAAWESTALREGAILVPAGPTLVGLGTRRRTSEGEEHSFTFALGTRWEDGKPRTEVALSFPETPVPERAVRELESGTAATAALRSVFPEIHVAADARHAVLVRPGFTADPAVLVPAVEQFVTWILIARGERAMTAAYR